MTLLPGKRLWLMNLPVSGESMLVWLQISDRKVPANCDTSVYGVQRTGARAQVQARLTERILSDPSMVMDPEIEKNVFAASITWQI